MKTKWSKPFEHSRQRCSRRGHNCKRIDDHLIRPFDYRQTFASLRFLENTHGSLWYRWLLYSLEITKFTLKIIVTLVRTLFICWQPNLLFTLIIIRGFLINFSAGNVFSSFMQFTAVFQEMGAQCLIRTTTRLVHC